MPDDAAHALTPYAASLGIAVAGEEHGMPLLALDFAEAVEGRRGHLHGGATSGLLETAAYAALRVELARVGRDHRMKPINITVQFLAGGKRKRTFALGRVTRLGRRIANVAVEAWQDERERPIATAILNVMLVTPEAG